MGEVITIDCKYIYDRIAAAFLIVEGKEAMFVENNTSHAIPLLLNALARAGLKPDQVKYAAITHVHLDHAGGTSALLQACPQAICLAHPKAARHIIHPERLVASARQVYGDEAFDRLYGKISAVPEKRVRIMQDGEELQLGNRLLKFFYTRGHATHHFCIYDSASEGVFTGDSFGLAYPDLQASGPFIFPTTTPTDFDPDEALASVDAIADCGASRAWLTHFGEFSDLEEGRKQLKADLLRIKNILSALLDSDLAGSNLEVEARNMVEQFFQDKLGERELKLSTEQWSKLKMDIDINAQGIAFKALRLRKQSLD